jgi:hypothetical protein
MISAKELAERNKTKRNVKKELFTKILSQMCRRIDMFHSYGKTECILTIPEFIWGYPTYEMTQTTLYMHRQLVRLGYRTSILSGGMIHVAWGPPPKKKKKTLQKRELEEQDLPSFANLRKAADDLRKKYTSNTNK